ncbi:hypothetical protein BH20ACI2_BH20ACI2_20460 [soil metagenome]
MKRTPESDWKHLRSLKGNLLEVVYGRINAGARQIVSDQNSSQHERFLRLFDYLDDGNKVVAECFDDWRRSNILEKLFALRRHDLLTDEHLAQLSAETREMMER